jgi:hypothetical protein
VISVEECAPVEVVKLIDAAEGSYMMQNRTKC